MIYIWSHFIKLILFRTSDFKTNSSLDMLTDGGNTLPSPPIILPILPQDDSTYENKTKFKPEKDIPSVREMAWTSLVDTATKATTKRNVDKMPDSNTHYVAGDAKPKISASNIKINNQETKTAVIRLSPEAVETEVTYFTNSNGQNEDLSEDENDKTIMDEVCQKLFNIRIEF